MFGPTGHINWPGIFVTYAKRIQDNPNSDWPIRYILLMPVWHPAVSPPSKNQGILIGKSEADCIKNFCNLDYACSNPYNIDAAIQYRKDYDKFVQKNKDIFQACKNVCPMCFLAMKPENALYCFHGHVFHDTCTDDTMECPIYECKYNTQKLGKITICL